MEQKLSDKDRFLSILSRGPVPHIWETTKTNLSSLGFNVNQDEFYKINSHGLRSDEFKKYHDGMHLLFAGCSNTFGLGNFIEDVWAHKVYSEISKNNKTSGYFNIGSPGATVSEILYQIFIYCSHYGYPDFVFINFPDYYREYLAILNIYDAQKIPESQTLNRVMIARNICMQYLSLLSNLELNGTKIIAATWDLDYMKTKEVDARNYFPDLIAINNDELANHCLKYQEENSEHLLKDYFILSFDEDHPGVAVHDFWYQTMYNKYKEVSNA